MLLGSPTVRMQPLHCCCPNLLQKLVATCCCKTPPLSPRLQLACDSRQEPDAVLSDTLCSFLQRCAADRTNVLAWRKVLWAPCGSNKCPRLLYVRNHGFPNHCYVIQVSMTHPLCNRVDQAIWAHFLRRKSLCKQRARLVHILVACI